MKYLSRLAATSIIVLTGTMFALTQPKSAGPAQPRAESVTTGIRGLKDCALTADLLPATH
jgi:hypothetical protein